MNNFPLECSNHYWCSAPPHLDIHVQYCKLRNMCTREGTGAGYCPSTEGEQLGTVCQRRRKKKKDQAFLVPFDQPQPQKHPHTHKHSNEPCTVRVQCKSPDARPGCPTAEGASLRPQNVSSRKKDLNDPILCLFVVFDRFWGSKSETAVGSPLFTQRLTSLGKPPKKDSTFTTWKKSPMVLLKFGARNIDIFF